MAAAQLNGSSDAAEERASTSAARPQPVLSGAAGGVEGLRTNGEVSRRALLGAALGVPLSCHPERVSGSSPPPAGRATSWTPDQVRSDEEGEWQRALTAFRAAEAEVRRIEGATAGGSVEEEETWLPAHDLACAGMDDALACAIAAPVPDLAAFAVKIELLFAHCIEPGAVEEEVAEAVMADSRRLALG